MFLVKILSLTVLLLANKSRAFMCTLFIADLHLSEHEPAITAGFFTFTKNYPPNALYILGDFFDFWIGIDDLIHYTSA